MFPLNLKQQILLKLMICNTLAVPSHSEALVYEKSVATYLDSLALGKNFCCDCVFDDHVYDLYCSTSNGIVTYDMINGSSSSSLENYDNFNKSSNDRTNETRSALSTSLSWICCSTASANTSSSKRHAAFEYQCLGEVPEAVTEIGVHNALSSNTLCPQRSTENEQQTLKEICKTPDHLKEVDSTLEILLICSIVLISLTILKYLCTPSLLNIHGKFIVGHLAFLTLFFGLQLTELFVKPGTINSSKDRTRSGCWVIGFLTYFTSISANLWLTAVNVDIFRTFRRKYVEDKEGSERRFIKYAIIISTLSILLSAVVFLSDQNLDDKDFFSPLIGCTRCFLPLNPGYSILIYYYGLIALLLVFNLVTFTLTNFAICSTQSATIILSPHRGAVDKLKMIMPRLVLFFKLFCVSGTAWTINFALWLVSDFEVPIEDKHAAARFFECFNVSHGFCYFLVFVCKPSTLRRIWVKYSAKKEYSRTSIRSILSSSRGSTVRRKGMQIM